MHSDSAKFKAATMAVRQTDSPLCGRSMTHTFFQQGSRSDPTIREVGNLGVVVTVVYTINTITVNSTGTLAASSTSDKHVRLWRLSDRRTIAIFECSRSPSCVTFSTDGKHIFTGAHVMTVLEWAVPEIVLVDAPKEEVSGFRGKFAFISDSSSSHLVLRIAHVKAPWRPPGSPSWVLLLRPTRSLSPAPISAVQQCY
jgi:WD40 repeat protein